MDKVAGVRFRDPERRERILDAAADLISQHGFLGVSLSDIGAAAGIVGSGIYRHFDSKAAILVEMFDRVVDHLLERAEQSFAVALGPEATLAVLVDSQVEMVFRNRALCQVWIRESANLPEPDRLRLRWKQRHYVALWEDTLCTLQPNLSADDAKVIVRAAIAAIHSVLSISTHKDPEGLAILLRNAACRVLEIAAVPSAGGAFSEGPFTESTTG